MRRVHLLLPESFTDGMRAHFDKATRRAALRLYRAADDPERFAGVVVPLLRRARAAG